MYSAYEKIFKKSGIPYVIVEAETGEMGGSGSHQFTVPCQTGEDVIVYTEDGSYAANIEKAAVDPIEKQQPDSDTGKIEEVSTPNVKTIEELCKFFDCGSDKFIKTLIYRKPSYETLLKEESLSKALHKDGRLAHGSDVHYVEYFAICIRGDHEVNQEKMTQLLGDGNFELAEDDVVEKITGAGVGFAGPIGLAEKVDNLFIDHSVAAIPSGISGANKTDTHLKNVVPGRDFPLDGENVQIADVRNAVDGDTYNGKKLLFRRGIEVGQVFKLGTKYSAKLSANYLDENGKLQPALMGCYGIGINRIMASAIETGNDENGIIWPISIAPFEVLITPIGDNEEIVAASNDIYNKLIDAGIDVLLDDRDARGGVKFKDADLLGIPVRITIGKKALAEGKVELKLRSSGDMEKIDLDNAADHVSKLVTKLKAELENA